MEQSPGLCSGALPIPKFRAPDRRETEETRMKKLIALVLAAMLCMAACAALAGFSGPEAEFLRALAEYTITRAA